MSTALNKAVSKALEGHKPEFWPSDFLHIVAKLIYQAGKKRGSSEILRSSNKLATLASGVAKRMSNEEYPLKKRFQEIMRAANEFDVFGYEELTEKIRQAYKDIVMRAYKSASEDTMRMDAKRVLKRHTEMQKANALCSKRDRAIRSIRHNDDIRSFAENIKKKAVSLATTLKNSEGGRKAAIILLEIARGVSILIAADTITEAISSYKELKHLRNDLNVIDMEMDKNGFYVEKSPKTILVKAGIKMVASSLVALLSAFARNLIKNEPIESR